MVSTLNSPTVTDFNHVNIPWFAKDERVQIGRKRSAEESECLPVDPRLWTRDDVQRWVETVCCDHHLPVPEPERFMMNGKAVCLMTATMFSNRMPFGGKTLFRDFQIRLAKALNNA